MEIVVAVLIVAGIAWFFAQTTAGVFREKGRDPLHGQILGACLGIFGLLIAFCLPRKD